MTIETLKKNPFYLAGIVANILAVIGFSLTDFAFSTMGYSNVMSGVNVLEVILFRELIFNTIFLLPLIISTFDTFKLDRSTWKNKVIGVSIIIFALRIILDIAFNGSFTSYFNFDILVLALNWGIPLLVAFICTLISFKLIDS
jgi:hypothetical protein